MSSGPREGVLYFSGFFFFSRRKEGRCEEREGRRKQLEAWKFTSAFKPFLRLWAQGISVRSHFPVLAGGPWELNSGVSPAQHRVVT